MLDHLRASCASHDVGILSRGQQPWNRIAKFVLVARPEMVRLVSTRTVIVKITGGLNVNHEYHWLSVYLVTEYKGLHKR